MDPLDEVLDLLSSYEDTPFATQPMVPPRPVDSKFDIIQLKIHALAVRAFTSENTILRNAQSPPRNGTGISTPILTSKVDESKDTLSACLSGLRSLERSLGQTNRENSKNIDLLLSQVKALGNTNLQLPRVVSSLSEVAQLRETIEETCLSLQNSLDSITSQSKEHDAKREHLIDNETQAVKRTMMRLDELQRDVKQLSVSIENGVGDITKRLEPLKAPSLPASSHTLDGLQPRITISDSGWKIQIKEATEIIKRISKGDILSRVPPVMESHYGEEVQGLISAIFDVGQAMRALSERRIDLDRQAQAIESDIEGLREEHSVALHDIDYSLMKIANGHFENYEANWSTTRPSVRALAESLKSYANEQLRFTDQLLGGQSDASFNGNCVDGSGGAWKEIGEKSNAMAKMVCDGILSLDKAVRECKEGTFEAGIIKQPKTFRKCKMIHRIMISLNALLKCVKSYHEDVDRISAGILEGRVPVLKLDPHLGPWRASRILLNNMTVKVINFKTMKGRIDLISEEDQV